MAANQPYSTCAHDRWSARRGSDPLMCLEGNHTVTEENRLSERQVLIQLAGRAELHLLGKGVKESDFFFSCFAVHSYSV